MIIAIAAIVISVLSIAVSGYSFVMTRRAAAAREETERLRTERQSRRLLRDNARHILAEYDSPPAGGTLVPRAWVEENMNQLRQQAGL